MDLGLVNVLKGRVTYHAFAERIITLIEGGFLDEGDSLPSSRELAAYLSTSRTTIARSFDELAARGYVKAVKGSRTQVTRGKLAESGQPTFAPARTFQWEHRFTDLARDAMDISLREKPINFTPEKNRFDGLPPALLPLREWQRKQQELISRPLQSGAHGLGDKAARDRSLRTALTGWLRRAKGIACSSDQIVVYSQKENALLHLSETLINSHDRIICDGPACEMMQEIYSRRTPNVVSVSIDSDRFLRDRLDEECRFALWLHVMSPCSAMFGTCLSEERCRMLLNKTGTSGLTMIEDGSYGDFRYAGDNAGSLYARDASGSIIYLYDFSRLLYPLASLTLLIVPKQLVTLFERTRHLYDFQTTSLDHLVLSELLSQGDLEKHIRRLWKLFRERRRQLIFVLKTLLRDKVNVLHSDSGTQITIRLVSPIAEGDVIKCARKAAFPLVSTSTHYGRTEQDTLFTIDFGALSVNEIEDKVRTFAGLLEDRTAECYASRLQSHPVVPTG